MHGIRLLLALVRADAYSSGAFGPVVARAARTIGSATRVAIWTLGMGGLGWVVGNLGFRRSAALTGLIGAVAGLAWGLWRERGRAPARDPDS